MTDYPYTVSRRNGRWAIVDLRTGRTYGESDYYRLARSLADDLNREVAA